jgi:phage N-6-adenine-methyltransferase
VSAVHYSSAFMAWRTPQGVFDDLHAEFGFTVDGCATTGNALLPRFWTERDEPLLRSWEGERVFINPPYGRQIRRWMEKAHTEQPHALVVALVPSRTDTAWWHDYVMPSAEIRFIKGRLDFGGERAAGHNAPFPSCVVVWTPPLRPALLAPVSVGVGVLPHVAHTAPSCCASASEGAKTSGSSAGVSE